MEKVNLDSESRLAEYRSKVEGLSEANLEALGENESLVRRLEGLGGKLEKVKRMGLEGGERERR